MNVSYVTMKFPLNSETFASNDVIALSNKKVNMSVHSIRLKSKNHQQLVIERGLNNIMMTHNSKRKTLVGIKYGIKNYKLTKDFICWILNSNKDNYSHLIKSLFFVPATLYTFENIQKEKPEIVHLFWGHYPSMVGYLVKKYMKDTIVTMFLGAYDLEMLYGGSKSIGNKVDKVFTHSNANIDLLRKIGIHSDNIKVSHRGVAIHKFNYNDVYNKKYMKFLYAGRLIKSKGVDKVIELFSEIKIKHPNATLVILGDGDYKKELVRLVTDLNLLNSVYFKGHVSQEEVFEEMKSTEFFLFFSNKTSERLPNVLKEAMLAKCICITTYSKGIEELIKDRQTGFVLNNGIKETILLIDEIIKSKSSCKSIGQNAQNHIINNFNVNKLMDDYVSEWIELRAKRDLEKKNE